MVQGESLTLNDRKNWNMVDACGSEQWQLGNAKERLDHMCSQMQNVKKFWEDDRGHFRGGIIRNLVMKRQTEGSSDKYEFQNTNIASEEILYFLTSNANTGKSQQLVKKLHCAIQIW